MTSSAATTAKAEALGRARGWADHMRTRRDNGMVYARGMGDDLIVLDDAYDALARRVQALEEALRWVADNWPAAVREMPTGTYRAAFLSRREANEAAGQ